MEFSELKIPYDTVVNVGNLRGKLNKSVIDNSFQTRYNEILSEIMRMWRNWQTHQP